MFTSRKVPIITLFLMIAASVFTLSLFDPVMASGRIKVVTSNSLLADLVRVVGGDKVSVTPVVSSAGCVHAYEPTPSDMKLVAGCRVYVREGLGDDAWADKMLRNVGTGGIRVIAAAKGLAIPHEHSGKNGESGESHAYFDLDLLARMVDRISSGLAKAEPKNSAVFAKNAKGYMEKLKVLKDWAAHETGTFKHVKVVSYSRALEGFMDSLGIEPIFVVEESHEQDVSPRRIAEAISVARGAKVVLGDAVLPSTARTIASEAGIGLVLLNPSPPKGKTFIRMYEDNVKALVRGIKGREGHGK